MKRLILAPRALADLREIAAYIAADDPDRATTFRSELEAKARQAADRPHSFRRRDDIAPGLRSIVYHRYLIFFRELDQHVRIERIIHSARDISRLSIT